MDWHKLLSGDRLGNTQADEDFRSPFQRDFDRVVFSSSLRRLQDKTQVFPLAKSDYVRTRLTHSLEVSSVGRSIGVKVGREILAREKDLKISADQFGEIVAAACIAHDIGNPPFGHSGEEAFRAWFRNPAHLEHLAGLNSVQIAELQNFEGNAQGFRVLTNLVRNNAKNPRYGGLQLTFATLGAFLKYPRQAKIEQADKSRISHKKFNFFLSEEDLFLQVVTTLGMIQTQKGAWCRHPLVFLVEAADDISYTIADFQDGYRLGHVSYEACERFFLRILGPKAPSLLLEIADFTDDKDRLEFLAGKAIGSLVLESAVAFLEHENELLAGTFEKPLASVIPSHSILKEMYDFAFQNIYSCTEVVHLKVAGFEVIHGLLDIFVPAVNFNGNKDHYLYDWTWYVLRLIPSQFLGPERKPDANPYIRLHQILDFISGMTDSYAVATFKQLKGIHTT